MTFLETQLHPKLKLPWIECGCRLSKPRQRLDAGTERIIRYSQIRAIQNVKSFSQQLQIDALRQLEPSTQTQIQRSEVKAAPGISSHTYRPIIVVSVKVAIASEQNIEWESLRISKDVANLETA